jgi:ribosomal protein S18 acetylase RimI-like enzyme
MPPKLRSSTRDFDEYGREVLERHGLSPVRYFFKMERDLAEPIPVPQFPEGYSLRHVENDADIQLWADCFNLSFIDHYNFHPTTVELQKHWRSDSNYVPEHDLIAMAPDGTVAAFCFCWIDPDNNERNNRLEGWIDVLGTRRGHRKIGLGKAMLLAGMLAIKEAGMEKAVLGVDAENPTGALGLYESVDFRPVMTTVGYLKDL